MTMFDTLPPSYDNLKTTIWFSTRKNLKPRYKCPVVPWLLRQTHPLIHVAQVNPWDAHFNNHQLGHPGLPDDADDFLLSAFDIPQSSAQGANPSHSIPITNQPPSDVWPSANPTPPDGPSQYISTNPTFQAAYTRPSSVADRPFTGSGELALAAHWQDTSAIVLPTERPHGSPRQPCGTW